MQNIDLKGVSIPTLYQRAYKSLTELILKICGGEASKFTITGKNFQKSKIINFNIDNFENLIGIPISLNEAQKNFDFIRICL